MVDVRGQDFSSVDEVLINDTPVSTFVVLGRQQLVVTLPKNVTYVSSVAVTSRRITLTDKSFLKFRLGKTPSSVSGVMRLMQLFIKVLFTTPGSDIFSKRLGSAGLRNISRTFAPDQSGGIISDFVVAVEGATRQIIAFQGRQQNLPQDERLLTARVASAHFSPLESALVVSVELTSYAGRAALANVVV